MIRPALAVIAMVLVAACGGSTLTSGPSAAPSAGSVAPSSATAAVPSPDPTDAPPAADLAAEGGDPVEGQLGTYTWRDGGSDAPWLPGALLAVAAGEPLTMTLRPTAGVKAWTARVVPAGADGPAGAEVLGRGSDAVQVAAPSSGRWTLEIGVTFADGLGQASYFWSLDVSG